MAKVAMRPAGALSQRPMDRGRNGPRKDWLALAAGWPYPPIARTMRNGDVRQLNQSLPAMPVRHAGKSVGADEQDQRPAGWPQTAVWRSRSNVGTV